MIGSLELAGKWTQPIGSTRLYFYDVDTRAPLVARRSGQRLELGTRQEIGTAGQEAFGWSGTGEAAIWNGTRWMDTKLQFAAIWIDRPAAWFTIDASAFPGRRVAVKHWHPAEGKTGHAEWFALVDRERGWRGNKADTGKLKRAEIGIARVMRGA